MWHYKTGEAVDRDQLKRITDTIFHRGPDSDGYYFGPGPGLGFRRLSIIDLEGGSQPICNEDGTVWIVFNGEIYNYPELRREVLSRGHTMKTRTDTETIIHLWEDFGPDCVKKLRGMFAFALWDQKKQQLLLARDRLGIKPLFYGMGERGIVFGSELKCIRESGECDLQIEPTALADVLTFFYIPGPKTIYRDVFMLEPAHYLLVSRKGVQKGKYWDLTESELKLNNTKDYEDRLYEILRQSVSCHLLADVPVGAFLSGGVDSSVVVGLMSKEVSEPVMTCSIGFEEKEFNELSRARAMAKLFKTDHHEMVVTPEPARILRKLNDYYDQPFPDHSSIPTYYVSQLARQRVKVVLSGDGGDENFGGYSRYVRSVTLKNIRERIPKMLLRPFANRKGDRLKGDLPTRLERVLHQLAAGARDGYLHGITVGDAKLRERLLAPEIRKQISGYDPYEHFRKIYDASPRKDALSSIFYLDIKTYLVDDILTKVDRASMANSLEVRVPILDHEVVEFAYALPLDMKLRGEQRKYLLRQAMSRLVPAEHMAAPKKGFRIPIGSWMRGDMRDWFEAAFFKDAELDAFLNRTGVRQVWERFQGGDSHLSDVLSVVASIATSRPVWATTARSAAVVGD